jgi:hypothetical protein
MTVEAKAAENINKIEAPALLETFSQSKGQCFMYPTFAIFEM